MVAPKRRRQQGRAPVHAAVLALVIEKPSYGYEVWQRFEQRFGGVLEVGSSRIYQVVNSLLDEDLIEEVPGEPDRSRRQPRPRYRATARGARAHRGWLADELRGDAQQLELRRRMLAIGCGDAASLLEIVDRCERGCLDEMAELRAADGETADVCERLLLEERRLVLEARMKWILFARRQLRTVAAGGVELADAS